MDNIQKISVCRQEALEKIFKTDNTKISQNTRLSQLQKQWKKLLPKYYKVVWPKQIIKNTAVLVVKNHLIYSELIFIKTELTKKISKALNEKDIKIKLFLDNSS